jgi:hypothetical protein
MMVMCPACGQCFSGREETAGPGRWRKCDRLKKHHATVLAMAGIFNAWANAPAEKQPAQACASMLALGELLGKPF